MSLAIRGKGEFNAEFDRRMESIERLATECLGSEAYAVSDPLADSNIRRAELESKLDELCDWINADPKVRRNLNKERYLRLSRYQHYRPSHQVWEKVATMLRTRETQNSIARKNLLREQREAKSV
jgi:hypothetical protein